MTLILPVPALIGGTKVSPISVPIYTNTAGNRNEGNNPWAFSASFTPIGPAIPKCVYLGIMSWNTDYLSSSVSMSGQGDMTPLYQLPAANGAYSAEYWAILTDLDGDRTFTVTGNQAPGAVILHIWYTTPDIIPEVVDSQYVEATDVALNFNIDTYKGGVVLAQHLSGEVSATRSWSGLTTDNAIGAGAPTNIGASSASGGDFSNQNNAPFSVDTTTGFNAGALISLR
jgi:hypothetical protein